MINVLWRKVKKPPFFPNPRCSWAKQNMKQLLILLFDPKTALGFKAETKKHISHGKKTPTFH